jgi:fatty-acyl-CoA synthase
MDLMNITIGQYLKKTASLFPDNIAIISFEEEKSLTWKVVDLLSDKYAKGLMALGLKKGDHIAIWGTNKIEWVLCFLAACKIGVITIPININYCLREVEMLLKQSEAEALVFIDGFRDIDYIQIVEQIMKRNRRDSNETTNLLKHFIHFGDKRCESFLELSELENIGKEITWEQFNARTMQLDADDVIVIQYTSGTTSAQKGVMLTHNNLINNSYSSGKLLKFSNKDRLCLAVPFFHCFGLSAGILMCIGRASAMVLVECYKAVKVMEAVSTLRCTALHGVPTMFSKVLEHPDFNKYDFSTLRTGIVAGAACNEKIIIGIIDKLGMKEIAVGYGQTESSPACTQTFADDPLEKRIETVGKSLPNVEMKVVDIRTGKDCAVGVSGELCTRGYHIMKGYFNNEELTKKVIDKEGWLHTGDIGFVDDEGYYHVCGRLKDIIIRGGENINPKEIEDCLVQHPNIKDAQVYGIPEECYGEEIAASLQIKEGCHIEPKEIRDFLSGKLAHYKIPKYIEVCNVYPVTASGKVKKCVLKDEMIRKIKTNSGFSKTL